MRKHRACTGEEIVHSRGKRRDRVNPLVVGSNPTGPKPNRSRSSNGSTPGVLPKNRQCLRVSSLRGTSTPCHPPVLGLQPDQRALQLSELSFELRDSCRLRGCLSGHLPSLLLHLVQQHRRQLL